MTSFTIFILIVLFIVSCLLTVSVFYLIRFARHILAIEDVLSEGIESLDMANESLLALLNMQMFFESPEVKKATMTALQDVALSQTSILKVVRNFTNIKNQKYEYEHVKIYNMESEENDS